MDNFESDFPAQPGIPGTIDATHTPGAELADDLVDPEASALANFHKLYGEIIAQPHGDEGCLTAAR